jgi:hypothetical protein
MTKLNEHKRTVLKFMNEQRALCVKKMGKVVRVLLFSKKHNMICCLAVLPEYRKRGIAPRVLYKKFGFVEDELIEEFGYPNQRLILYP